MGFEGWITLGSLFVAGWFFMKTFTRKPRGTQNAATPIRVYRPRRTTSILPTLAFYVGAVEAWATNTWSQCKEYYKVAGQKHKSNQIVIMSSVSKDVSQKEEKEALSTLRTSEPELGINLEPDIIKEETPVSLSDNRREALKKLLTIEGVNPSLLATALGGNRQKLLAEIKEVMSDQKAPVS